jgi:hypothetical protein
LGLVSYNSPGHPDHHGLILIASTLLIGLTLRLLREDSHIYAVASGSLAAAGIWVATEFLLPLAICLVFLLGKWIATGERLRAIQLMTYSLFAGLVLALMLERPIASWADLQADRISLLHVAMAALLAVGSWLLGSARALTTIGRAIPAVAVCVGSGALMHVMFPGFFLGPVAAIPASVDRFFDEYITELAPTWLSVGEEWAGLALVLGGPVLALIFGAWMLRKTQGSHSYQQWMMLVAWQISAVILALVSFRYVAMAEVLVGIPLVAAVEPYLRRPERRTTRIVRPLLLAWCLVGYLVLVVAASAFGRDEGALSAGNCALELIESDLREALEPYADPIVLAPVPAGPELIWRLPVAVVGTPYHTEAAGIEFTQEVFRSEDKATSVALLEQRGVDAVLVCDGEPGSSGYRKVGSFYSSIIGHASVPGWHEHALPAGSPFRLYLRS